jgi:Spy/CpxP family protein refolding chaperone
MEMNKLLMATFVGSTILAASVWAALPEPGVGPAARGRRGFDAGRMQTELGLSEDQVAQLQKMRSESRSESIRRRADLRIAQGELRDLLRAPAEDENANNAKVKQVTDLQAAATRSRVEHRLALREILTPEQLAKMESLGRGHRREGGRKHRGHRGPRPSGPVGEPGPGTDE